MAKVRPFARWVRTKLLRAKQANRLTGKPIGSKWFAFGLNLYRFLFDKDMPDSGQI